MVIPDGILIEDSFEQFQKHPSYKYFTLLGTIIVSAFEQSQNILNIDNQQLMN